VSDMRCSCDQARRQARAEAFAEAAEIVREEAEEADPIAAAYKRLLVLAHAPERASSTPPSAATEDDGFVTVWPALDSGVGLA
jgi:hypothetical protein